MEDATHLGAPVGNLSQPSLFSFSPALNSPTEENPSRVPASVHQQGDSYPSSPLGGVLEGKSLLALPQRKGNSSSAGKRTSVAQGWGH